MLRVLTRSIMAADLTWQAAAQLIDHTLLKPEATPTQVEQLCEEARHYGMYSVMVNPCYVAKAVEWLQDCDVKVGTVVGFPLGANTTNTKLVETQQALTLGAKEIDMVINIGLLKSNLPAKVQAEIQTLAKAVHARNCVLKVILETALLTQEEKVLACKLAVDAGADYVKTSTGFAAQGATAADVSLMRETVGASIGVKASGGIRTAADLQLMVQSGATRIGASASVSILKELGAR